MSEEHRERHKKLHKALDELAADYLSQTERTLTDTDVMQLMQWSYKQTLSPTGSLSAPKQHKVKE